ncbi:cyclase family protein [Pseudoclavibacter sp. VKM Ac-2867]|uniref:cyclase family protein n=1 Tax=Pseudoclavibacter sp. VKM Ac-2867 TaxID=2783829 RepID=UPI00188D5390|nr:cyclase family protein [Pseudoclavibacter sp. VKM Ac-2867]MBF4459022.1 cyclase family protein [Pseudoclavibacter sp. VKM Ac-2867]
MTLTLVDLTHPLVSGMQIYPGDPEVQIAPATSLTDDGVVVHAVQLGTHTGTHLDAPSHSIADGATVDRLDLGRLVGPLHLVDVTELAQPGRRIELAQVAAQLERLAAGAIVVFRTDWSKRFGQPGYLEHPFLDAAIADRLLSAGVTVIGVDTLSPDRTDTTAASADLPFHDVFLGAGGVIIENLTNLSAVDPARDPWISALPLPFAGLDGSPVRAVAMHRS